MESEKIKCSNLFVVGNHEFADQSDPEGLSLAGYNPEPKDFFEMAVSTASELRERLMKDYPETFVFYR